MYNYVIFIDIWITASYNKTIFTLNEQNIYFCLP
jgi:hypothetical protein